MEQILEAGIPPRGFADALQALQEGGKVLQMLFREGGLLAQLGECLFLRFTPAHTMQGDFEQMRGHFLSSAVRQGELKAAGEEQTGLRFRCLESTQKTADGGHEFLAQAMRAVFLRFQGLLEVIHNEQHGTRALFFLAARPLQQRGERGKELRGLLLHPWQPLIHQRRDLRRADALAEGIQNGCGIVAAKEHQHLMRVLHAPCHTGGEAGFPLTAHAVDEDTGLPLGSRCAKLAQNGLNLPATPDKLQITCHGHLLPFHVEESLRRLSMTDDAMRSARLRKHAAAFRLQIQPRQMPVPRGRTAIR